MLATARTLIRGALVLIASVAAFYYVGDFGSRQSVALGLAFALLYHQIDAIRKYQSFEPFEVTIHPHWALILEDLRLLPEGPAEAKGRWLRERVQASGTGSLRLLDEGLRMTFLTRGTAFIHQIDSFSSLVDVRIRLFELERSGLLQFVGFYVRFSPQGYELGLVTPESFSRSSLVQDDRERLPIATIPRSVLALYMSADASAAVAKRDLAKHGWALREENFEIDSSLQFTHRCFTVAISPL